MNKNLLFALLSVSVSAIACGNEVQSPTKASVAQAIGAGQAVDDGICTSNGWNGDGECDAWCPDGDIADCGDDDIVCAAFIEESDGVCSRPETDPCRNQDPDCDVQCATYIERPDGVCSRDEFDPCRSQDPDCDLNCPDIAQVSDGVCDESPDEPCPTDPDCNHDCIELQASDGICTNPNDSCHNDPDCEYACIEPAYPQDGICTEQSWEPCPLDPDCPWY